MPLGNKTGIYFVHARTLENSFIADSFGLNRQNVMKNSFVIAGPPEDPMQIKACKGVLEAFRRILEKEALFISRGGNSGTHIREKELWKLVGAAPAGDWYRQSNTGMADTLHMASQGGAYCLTDQGTFLSHHDELRLVTVLQGGQLLHNPYCVIAVNPGKVPAVDFHKAMLLVDFLTGLVVCNSHSDGYSLVAAGNLRRQISSTYFSRPPVSSLYLTYWHGEITHHSHYYKPLVPQTMAYPVGRREVQACAGCDQTVIYGRGIQMVDVGQLRAGFGAYGP